VDTQTFSQALDLIQMLIIVVGMFLLYRSVPAAQLEQLVTRLEATARTTQTPVDDTMVGFLRLLMTLVTGQQLTPATADGQPVAQPQPTPVPMTVTGTLTASPAPSTPTADTVLETDAAG
jgi:hypothetical protein